MAYDQVNPDKILKLLTEAETPTEEQKNTARDVFQNELVALTNLQNQTAESLKKIEQMKLQQTWTHNDIDEFIRTNVSIVETGIKTIDQVAENPLAKAFQIKADDINKEIQATTNDLFRMYQQNKPPLTLDDEDTKKWEQLSDRAILALHAAILDFTPHPEYKDLDSIKRINNIAYLHDNKLRGDLAKFNFSLQGKVADKIGKRKEVLLSDVLNLADTAKKNIASINKSTTELTINVSFSKLDSLEKKLLELKDNTKKYKESKLKYYFFQLVTFLQYEKLKKKKLTKIEELLEKTNKLKPDNKPVEIKTNKHGLVDYTAGENIHTKADANNLKSNVDDLEQKAKEIDINIKDDKILSPPTI
ncbi:MAG: hypothetical protein KKE11_00250 [Gammaproteobacteria bacterium]|nr:hypothetical protein [Gammaproteobacteria bacterium]